LNETERDVIRIVSVITRTPADVIGVDTDLRLDLNVDSLQGLQIVAAVEKRFGVEVPDDDLDVYTSVRAIVDALARLRGRS
jgi:acyl carrier protein